MNCEYPEQTLAPSARERLARSLADYARQRRWFRAKARTVSGARVADVVPLETSALVILEIGYRRQTDRDLYVVPLARVSDATAVRATAPHAVVAELDEGGALVDTLASGQLGPALLALLRHGRAIAGESGRVRGEADPLFTELVGGDALAVEVPRGEQTNSSLVFGDRLLLKVYRQLSAGENPELEVGRYLTAHCQPPCAPRVLGALTYQDRDGESRSLGIAHELLANQGDAWTLALREVREFFAQVEGGAPPGDESPVDGGVLGLALAGSRPSVAAVERFCAMADVLGRRTGELHLALASDTADPAFAPEPITATDRRALSARAEAMLDENLGALGRVASRLPHSARMLAERLLAPEGRQAIIEVLARFRVSEVAAQKTRTHGDLHLGQVLVRPGNPVDFVIIDFEGEPGRPLPERRARSSPLRDVMAMARSFDYAPQAVLRAPQKDDDGTIRARREPWARLWTRDVTAAYLRGYFQVVKDAPFLPARREELTLLCRYYELEKVIYELGYEANNRPDWLEIPVRGLASVAAVAAAGSDR